jgi:tetratricopeptide (TPR) repeat protein
MTRRRLSVCGLALVLIAGASQASAEDVTLLRAREGAAALLRGQYDKALAAYDEALSNPEIADFVKASIYSDRGVAKWRLKQTKEAVDDFNQSIQISPESASVYNNRGNALMDLGHPDEAVKDFDRAIALSPNYGAAYNNRGNAHAVLAQYEPAFQDYRKAVELMPTSAVALNGRGKAHASLERYHAAVRDYSRALALNTRYDAAYENRGEAYLALRRYGEAAGDFTQALASKPDQPDVLLLRARAYAGDKKYNTAVEDLGKAIELKPDLTDAYIERGEVYTQVRRLPDAITDLTRAIELSPQDAKAYAMRAEARMRATPPKKPEPVSIVAKQPEAAPADPNAAPPAAPGAPADPNAVAPGATASADPNAPAPADANATPDTATASADPNAAAVPADPNAATPADPNAAVAPADPNAVAAPADPNAAPADPNAATPGANAAADPNSAAPTDASADPNNAPAADAAPEPVQADDEALKDLQEALTLAPDDPVALRLRGDFYQATGKTTEAIADYQAALAKDPFQSESRDALEKLGQDVLAEQGLPLAPPVSDWVVTEPSPGRYVATNPKYKKLRAELEMFGSGKPKIIEWTQMKDALAGIGLLRYYAGDLAEGANQELLYTAIIDLSANKVVTIEPYSWGANAAKWDWQAYSVVITDPDGTPNEIKLRKPKVRPVAREGGFFDPWGGPRADQAAPRGRRGGGGGGGGGLFGWFGR